MSKLVGFNILGVVFFTGKPDQALIEDVDAPWVHARHQNIEPNIRLKPINEQWVVDIP